MIPDGIILLDKKKGITSMASDNFIKRVAGTSKAGHSGTLDPFATGLLPIFTGRALKVMRYTDDYDKEYECTAVFGVRTATMDPEGEVTASFRLSGSDKEFNAIREAFESVARITCQIPPSYSAKKIGGRKAYELARSGIDVKLSSHPVSIYSLDVGEMRYEDGRIYADFRVSCSKGTYVRSLCDEAGEITGFHAHAGELRRISAGPFCIRDAFTEERISDMASKGDFSFVRPREEAVRLMPRIELDDAGFADIRLGRKISSSPFGDLKDGVRVCAFHEGTLSAVLYRDGDILRIERMLAVEQ